jgi:hypothetical protein
MSAFQPLVEQAAKRRMALTVVGVSRRRFLICRKKLGTERHVRISVAGTGSQRKRHEYREATGSQLRSNKAMNVTPNKTVYRCRTHAV